MKKNFIIFTDLDATLLDENYSWEKAKPALNELNKLKIPLILNSSKTICEIEMIRKDLNIFYPVVAENGAVIGIPNDFDDKNSNSKKLNTRISGSLSREEIVKIINKIREENNFKFEGFSDWSIEKIMDRTDLSKREAKRSNNRLATEPIKWLDSMKKFENFCEEINVYGLGCVSGGRFKHIMPLKVDKGTGLTSILSIYRKKYPKENFCTISLGDSYNDIPMFNKSNFSILISKLNSTLTNLKFPNLVVSKKYGPSGWNEELLKLLNNNMDFKMVV